MTQRVELWLFVKLVSSPADIIEKVTEKWVDTKHPDEHNLKDD